MNQKKHLIVIGGATATGKTAAAIRLALHFGTEIISADSRQFYREMNIGTAKPTEAELALVPHHFIGSQSILAGYTVGDYERGAAALFEKLFEKKGAIIMVGGSGLFIRAVCEGLDSFPEVPEAVHRQLLEAWKTGGIGPLQMELAALDPTYLNIVDLQNPVRVIRALGVCRASGKPFSGFWSGGKTEQPFEPIYLRLDVERALLYQRIEERVDKMLEHGLLEEAKSLFEHRHLNPLQTVGYQELFDFMEGEISMEKAVELIKRNSRRYAKRQMTWFRKSAHWTGFEPTDFQGMIDFVETKMKASVCNQPDFLP